MLDIRTRLAQPSDHDQLLRMREALWPNASSEEHSRELRLILEGRAPVTMPLIILVAESSARTLAGFLEVDLRSHADGCNPSRPVGYVEGWYVTENYRRKGVGKKLFAAAEDWARNQGWLRSLRTPGLTIWYRSACTRPWGIRWWTAAYITGKHYEEEVAFQKRATRRFLIKQILPPPVIRPSH